MKWVYLLQFLNFCGELMPHDCGFNMRRNQQGKTEHDSRPFLFPSGLFSPKLKSGNHGDGFCKSLKDKAGARGSIGRMPRFRSYPTVQRWCDGDGSNALSCFFHCITSQTVSKTGRTQQLSLCFDNSQRFPRYALHIANVTCTPETFHV